MTRDDEETIRLRQAFAAPVPAALHMEDCPEPDHVWSAVRGELPPDEIREILDHVALCASCAEDWRIAMAFEEEARQRETAPVVPIHRYRPWVAAAAAALVLTIGGIYLRQTQGPAPTPGYRGDGPKIEAAIPSEEILQRDACVLTWKAVQGAESYNLLVTTGNLTTIAYPKELTSTSYQIPAEDLAGLPSGALLHWTVTAVYPDGGKQSSPLFTNRLQ